MPAPDDSPAWRALLLNTWPQGKQDRAAPIHIAPLRVYVCEFVRDAKARGEPPEQVIRALKEQTTRAVLEIVPRQREVMLLDAIFEWCLDEYYGASTTPAAAATAPSPERV